MLDDVILDSPLCLNACLEDQTFKTSLQLCNWTTVTSETVGGLNLVLIELLSLNYQG